MSYDTSYAYLFIKWSGILLFSIVALKFLAMLMLYI